MSRHGRAFLSRFLPHSKRALREGSVEGLCAPSLGASGHSARCSRMDSTAISRACVGSIPAWAAVDASSRTGRLRPLDEAGNGCFRRSQPSPVDEEKPTPL